MNLLQVLHQRWSDDPALDGLLPTGRVFTGMSSDRAPPYAVISKVSQRPVSLPGDGSAIDSIVVQFRVFHDHYDAGAEILQQVKATFDRTAFDLADSKEVFNMQRTKDAEEQHADGLWEFTISFECTVYLPTGV
jgi:hypothetical protein